MSFSEFWEGLGGWQRTGIILAGGLVVHIVIRVFVLRGLSRLAAATENDLDDRLVHFFRRFYAIALVFILIVLILNANGIEITPLLASAGIAGGSESIGRQARHEAAARQDGA